MRETILYGSLDGDGAEASGCGWFLWNVAEVQGCDDFYGMLLKFESMADFMECC